ncbi:hypothetical protein DPMN_031478 [Dreissena polymorpha]|uniref:Uncharacterized protein n=1 Tax=Dreissena polymorpha TaxID=45954 RepID=A0A9D4RJC9_DREPO|nr:hypothetical protein DPMN_031478 [Dreissena polymorpha]
MHQNSSNRSEQCPLVVEDLQFEKGRNSPEGNKLQQARCRVNEVGHLKTRWFENFTSSTTIDRIFKRMMDAKLMFSTSLMTCVTL